MAFIAIHFQEVLVLILFLFYYYLIHYLYALHSLRYNHTPDVLSVTCVPFQEVSYQSVEGLDGNKENNVFKLLVFYKCLYLSDNVIIINGVVELSSKVIVGTFLIK